MGRHEGNWFWLDLETTGLEPGRHTIVEVAAVITDQQLNELAAYSTLVTLEPGYEVSDWAAQVHGASGLWDEMLSGQPQIRLVNLTEWLVKVIEASDCAKGPESPGSPLCGATINFDRAFLKHFAPQALTRLSYRNIDVSSVHQLGEAWYTTSHDGVPSTPHRALLDIRLTIDRLRWYRARMFNPHGRR